MHKARKTLIAAAILFGALGAAWLTRFAWAPDVAFRAIASPSAGYLLLARAAGDASVPGYVRGWLHAPEAGQRLLAVKVLTDARTARARDALVVLAILAKDARSAMDLTVIVAALGEYADPVSEGVLAAIVRDPMWPRPARRRAYASLFARRSPELRRMAAPP